jgi:hypothetical protein
MLKHGTYYWVEPDTTTQRGDKHVMAAIVRYWDKAKKTTRRWCFGIGEQHGPKLTSDVLSDFLVNAAKIIGFTPWGLTSDSDSENR